MELIPDKRKLVGLVEQARDGKICLPEFQRDFIWRRDEVADLLRSILRRYYIGSLLLLRCDPQAPPFAPAAFQGARPVFRELHPELLVLDGQQRLTALLYALTAPELTLKDSSQRRWFFLDLKLLLEDPYDDEIVFDRAKRELDGLDKADVQYARRILSCTALLTSQSFLSWRDGLDDWLRDHEPEKHRIFRERWRDAWTKAVTDFQTFEIPLVELPRVSESDRDAIGRVCAIFEKLNSTGVELSVYDLLTARLYRSGIKLHTLWKEASKEHKRLYEWSEGKADTNKFGVLVLRTLALLRGLDPKPRFLINLDPENFEADWRRAAAAMDRALELTTHVGPDGFGVFNRKWLPGFGLLPVMAALRAEIEDRRLGEAARNDLRRWYWSNVFLERYSSAVESKSRKDYAELLGHWTEGKPQPTVFAEARSRIGAPGYSVRDSASTASAVYNGIFCLLALRGARDWRRGEAIQLQDLHDHHVFPQAYLRRHGVIRRVDVNTIVNRTLISDETNGRIKDRAPAEYLANRDIFPAGASATLLAPHFIDDNAVRAMQQATEQLGEDVIRAVNDAYLKAREALIVAEIRAACGIVEEVVSADGGAELREAAANIELAASEADSRQYLRNKWAQFTTENIETCLEALGSLAASGVPGVIVVTRRNGRPGLVLQSPRFGPLTVLLASTSQPAVRDALDATKRYHADRDVVGAWGEYQAALLKVPGASAGGTKRPRVYVPVTAIGPNIGLIVAALRKLSQALG